MSGLPSGWALAALSDLCKQPEQRVPHADEMFTYIDIASVDRDLKIVSAPQRLLGADAPSRARKLVESGDVIVSMTRPNLNAVALIGKQYNDCIASTGFDVLKPIEVEPRWIFSAVKSARFVDAMCEKVQGALYPAVKSADIREHEIPLPPLAEQTRIAEKLDELLAQVDALKARIDAIPALLKRFRQSVLAAAVSGRLTEGWGDHSTAVSQASKAPLGELITEMRNGLSAKPNEDGKGLPILRISSVRAGSVDQTDIRFLECGEADKERYSLKDGDLLFTRYNGSLELVGVCGLLRQLSHATLVYPDKLIRVRCNTDIVLPDYLEIFFSELSTRQLVMDLVKSTSGQKGISGQDLKEIVVTYPDLTEQTEIVRRVEQLFAFADQLEAKVASAKSRIDHLTQSILAKAFRGELVSQDPNDEPASVLLERIKAQRAAAPKAKRGRKSA
nr:restriction endonuclease subunit S [uncultured Pseudomonas sp.]